MAEAAHDGSEPSKTDSAGLGRVARLFAEMPWLPSFARYFAFASFAFFVIVLTWYIGSFPENAPTPLPTWEVFDGIFQKRVDRLADVGWHVGLVMNGYEGMPAGDPYASQHNWAYFPLTVYAGKFLDVFIKNPVWSLQILALLSASGLMTLVQHEIKRRDGLPWTLRHEALLVLFVLPIVWPCINFTVLATLVEFALFFWLLRLSRENRDGDVSTRAIVITAALALAAGFSRSQGLMVNCILAASVLWAFRKNRKTALLLAGVLVLPIPLVLLFYKVQVGDALAFYRIQRAWGRTLSTPWGPWISALKPPPFIIGEFHDMFFTVIRALIALAATIDGTWRLVKRSEDDRPRTVELGILAASFVLFLLPSTTSALLGMHRLYTLALFPFVLGFNRGLAGRLGNLAILMICFLRVAEMALFFDNRFFAIW